MISKLMHEMTKAERWDDLLKKAEDKGLDNKMIQSFILPEKREELLNLIANDQYSIFPPKIALIPKGGGEYRTVYVNSDRDRIVLTLINDCLCDLFKDMIHPACKSYQKGLSTQKVVKEISRKICTTEFDSDHIGYKSDFSKYFDTVKIEAIDAVWNELEDRLGFERGTEPVLNLLRRYYHQDLYFDQHENLLEKFQSLKQGCAVASFLANVILYDLDEFMSNKYDIYYRYSDDCIVIDAHTEDFIDEMNDICNKYGVQLNPKKVQALNRHSWFKFLGFLIREDQITLSPNRVKTFQKEVEKRSIKRKKCTGEQTRKSIYRYLYEGEYCWASSCLGTINVKKDLDQLNSFILDCIRACETNKKKIGGLGSVLNESDHTIVRGKGRHVKSNKLKTDKEIDRYLSVGCLANDMKMSYSLFRTIVKAI